MEEVFTPAESNPNPNSTRSEVDERNVEVARVALRWQGWMNEANWDNTAGMQSRTASCQQVLRRITGGPRTNLSLAAKSASLRPLAPTKTQTLCPSPLVLVVTSSPAFCNSDINLRKPSLISPSASALPCPPAFCLPVFG